MTGKTVTLAESGGNSKVAATNATTNNSGMATFAVSDSTAESVKYTADDTSDSIDLSAIPVTVTFTAVAAASTTTTTTTHDHHDHLTFQHNHDRYWSGDIGHHVNWIVDHREHRNTGTASVSTASSLATTGPSTLLPWLIGFGALFLAVGTIGRRRFKGESNEV